MIVQKVYTCLYARHTIMKIIQIHYMILYDAIECSTKRRVCLDSCLASIFLLLFAAFLTCAFAAGGASAFAAVFVALVAFAVFCVCCFCIRIITINSSSISVVILVILTIPTILILILVNNDNNKSSNKKEQDTAPRSYCSVTASRPPQQIVSSQAKLMLKRPGPQRTHPTPKNAGRAASLYIYIYIIYCTYVYSLPTII